MDSIVSDPPYGLGKEPDALEMLRDWLETGHHEVKGNGFMSQKWDAFVPQPEIWKECLRVLKPGGHLLSFAGTRTMDLVALGLRIAGFELRDSIGYAHEESNGAPTLAWCYACLSEDTEILTRDGWETYKYIDGKDVLCYDIEKDTFIFHKPTKRFIYDNEYPAYRIQSDNTDQLVSRNHRCIVERNGKKVFDFAENLGEYENIPFLESLSELPKNIFCDTLEKEKSENVFERLSNKINNIKTPETPNNPSDRNNLSTLRENFHNKERQNSAILFSKMQREDKGRVAKGTQIRQNGDEIPRIWPKGREKSRVERGSNILQKTWKLCDGKIRSVSGGILTHVSKRWIHNGTQADNGDTFKENFIPNGGCSSYKPQSEGQSDRKLDVISDKPRTQTIRSTRAKVTPIEYSGKMWCVESPTGAFVARRNGKIFITGNSGFPKGTDMEKAINKIDKVEFEKLPSSGVGFMNPEVEGGYNVTKNQMIQKGESSERAKQWSGWNTTLKPSFEPIILARKPVSEKTVVKNVLKWGTGAINIGACRVGSDVRYNSTSGSKSGSVFKLGIPDRPNDSPPIEVSGRWPANFIHDGSDDVVKLFPETKSCAMKHDVEAYDSDGVTDFMKGVSGPSNQYNDSGSAARFYYCAKASKEDREEGITDEIKESVSGIGALRDSGRESKPRRNIHPCVKPTNLMRWLCRLVTPVGGMVLDPFMGSGSTGKAAILEGFNFTGIEMNEEYFKIAEQRINSVKPKEEPIKIPEDNTKEEITNVCGETEQMCFSFDLDNNPNNPVESVQ